MYNIFGVPDTQCKFNVPTAHLTWAGQYVADYQPDMIWVAGDMYDMPSLSSYDTKHHKVVKGYTVSKDIKAGNEGMNLFMAPWRDIKGYDPKLVFSEGNHERRIKRFLEENPEIDVLPDPMLWLAELGWKVVPFQEYYTFKGTTFCHYFSKNSKGQVMNDKRGANSAMAQIKNEMRSTIAGHKQGLDTAHYSAGGRTVRGIISGSFYQHEEAYKGKQGNDHWQGCWMLHDVRDGNFDLEEISLGRLRRMYR